MQQHRGQVKLTRTQPPTSASMHTFHNPSVPFVHPLYEHLTPGTDVHIHGHVNKHEGNLGEQFVVEFLSGPHITLHVNFRFNQHCLVLNASGHGNWGEELRFDNPIHNHDHFHLHLHVSDDHYSISVNDHHIANFPHRFPYQAVEAIGIRGCLRVDKVTFEGFPFANSWNTDVGSHDYGHAGFIGYGTDSYAAPQFPEGHAKHHHW